MTTRQMLQRGWAVLEPPVDRALASYPLDGSSDHEACRLAVDRVGARHLLVPVTGDSSTRAQRGSELVVEERWLVFGEIEHSYLDVSCARADLYLEFDNVIVDVVEAVRESDNSGQATLEAVGRWRRLFRAAAARGLSTEARRGLFAELSCLLEFVKVDASLDVGSWTGPLGLPHDFEFKAACLEVKAAGAGSDDIRVHGLDQLDTHDEKPLHLVVLTVVEDRNGRSVLDLVDELMHIVRDPVFLRRRLTAVGWAEDDPFAEERYSLGPAMVVPVNAGVPRLVRGTLVNGEAPEGIHRVEYSIDRSALVAHASLASLSRLAGEVMS